MTISVAAITAVGAALAVAVKAFRAGETKGKQTKTELEPNPLPVAMVSELATKEEMREQEGRLVAELKRLETALTGERSVARTANGTLHARIDKMAEGLASVTATMTQMNGSLNRVLDLLVKSPNRRTPQ
jgi:hypothetical protein